jgi:hypothetical protein
MKRSLSRIKHLLARIYQGFWLYIALLRVLVQAHEHLQIFLYKFSPESIHIAATGDVTAQGRRKGKSRWLAVRFSEV